MDQPLFLQEAIPQLLKGFNIDYLLTELRLVKEVENSLNSEELFEEKLNIAASGDRTALAKYHSKILSKRITKINESIDKLSEEQYNRINNELEKYRSVIVGIFNPIYEHIQTLVNESGGGASLTLGAPPAQVVDFSKLDATMNGGASTAGSSWSIMGILNSIMKALTGNYSILGIFQLVLDLLGLIPGYGIIFDIINALIYLFNGEYVLMALSLVAIIPGAGDAIGLTAKSLVKPIVKPVQEIFGLLVKGDPKATSQALDAAGPAAKSFFKDYVRPALAFVPKLIADGVLAINGLLKFLLGWTKYVPYLGSAVKTFFNMIESWIVKFKAWIGGMDSTLLKSLDEAEALAKVVSREAFEKVQAANVKILKEGGEVAFEEGTQNIVFKSAKGDVLAEVPAEKFLNDEIFGAKFPGAKKTTTTTVDTVQTQKRKKGGRLAQKQVRETNSWVWTYSKTKSTPKLIKGLAGITKNFFTWKGAILLGKLIYKYFTGGNAIPVNIEGVPVNILDEADYAYVSSAALTDYVQQTLLQRKEQTGEIYNPTVVFNSLDMDEKKGFDMTESYLRDMARKTGQPSIIPVIYDKYKEEMDPELKGAMDETFASLMQKEKEEGRLGWTTSKNTKGNSSNSGNSADPNNIEIEGIDINVKESYSRTNWKNPFSKFK